MDSLSICWRGNAGSGKRTNLIESLKHVAASRRIPFNIQMKLLSFDSGNASTVAKGDDDDGEKPDSHQIEYESSLVHIGFDIARMSMQDKNILRPVLMNYGKGSNVLSGENGHGKRIVVLYHAHLLSSESVLILQSVLEQNENDISIWITSEIPVIQRIRDWFVEVGVSSENDKSFDKMKQANEHINHNWHDIFKNKILQWKKNNQPNLNEVQEIKKFIYEILMRNLRWVECVHFLLDVIISMEELSENEKTKLLYVLSETQATGGYITLPSYRIPIVWENLFLKLRNAILEDETTVSTIGNVDRKCKKSKSTTTTRVG
jgi:hypothetical protein